MQLQKINRWWPQRIGILRSNRPGIGLRCEKSVNIVMIGALLEMVPSSVHLFNASYVSNILMINHHYNARPDIDENTMGLRMMFRLFLTGIIRSWHYCMHVAVLWEKFHAGGCNKDD